MKFEIIKEYIEVCRKYGFQPDLRDLNKFKEITS